MHLPAPPHDRQRAPPQTEDGEASPPPRPVLLEESWIPFNRSPYQLAELSLRALLSPVGVSSAFVWAAAGESGATAP